MPQISIVSLSEVREDNPTFRLDADFFHPHIQSKLEKIKKHSYSKLSNLVNYNARIGQPIYKKNSDITILNSRHIRNDFIELEGVRKGTNRSIIKKGDILINSTGVGTLGRSNIFILEGNFTIDTDIIIIRANKINSFYLNVFLQTSFGQSEFNRRYSGTSGMIHIYSRDLNEFLIPLFSVSFQEEIESLVVRAHSLRERSQSLYKEAEDLLLTELGFKDWEPEKPRLNIIIKKKSEVDIAERIDADYFQAKYDQILNKIKTYRGGYTTLGEVVQMIKSLEVGSDQYIEKQEIPFIRVSNLTHKGIQFENAKNISFQLYETLKDIYQPKKNEILLSKDGTIGLAYYLAEETLMILSGGILRLILKNNLFNAQTLTLILNSCLVKKQAEQTSGGALIEHWLIDNIKKTCIPKVNETIQKQIAEKIEQSFQDQKESKRLLELAKKTVETAIETDGQTAIHFLD